MEVSLPRNANVFLVAFVALVCMDLVWLGIVAPQLGLYSDVRMHRPLYGLVAWTALAFAIASLRDSNKAWTWGAGVGLTTYLVFNGTELAIRDTYALHDAVADTAWGVLVCSVSSWLAHAQT